MCGRRGTLASDETGTTFHPWACAFRLKASFNTSVYPPQARVVLEALKKYGMIVADNGSDLVYQRGAR